MTRKRSKGQAAEGLGVRDVVDNRIKYYKSEGTAWKHRPTLANVVKVADLKFCIMKVGLNGDNLVFCRDHRWRKLNHTTDGFHIGHITPRSERARHYREMYT